MSLKSTQEVKSKDAKGLEFLAKEDLEVSASSDDGILFFDEEKDIRLPDQTVLKPGRTNAPSPPLTGALKVQVEELQTKLRRIESSIEGLRAQIDECKIQDYGTIVPESEVELAGQIAKGYKKLEYLEKEKYRILAQMEALKEN